MRIFFSMVFLLLVVACSNPFDTSIRVKYEVVGSAETVNITFENGSGGISQMANVALPWSHSFSADSDDYVYLYAQNQGETGSITVTIYKDGDVFKRATSEGAYVVASVSGNL
ncbi:MAG: MmpS family protein [Candidatus Sabulitectum sp.]|nr:MmpS family protein [Candidatus Sabulitectum sp.]